MDPVYKVTDGVSNFPRYIFNYEISVILVSDKHNKFSVNLNFLVIVVYL
jgi:hypothetical protein